MNLYIFNIFQAKSLTALPRLASLGQLSLSSGDHGHMERKPQHWQAVQEPSKYEALSIPNTEEEGKKSPILHSSYLVGVCWDAAVFQLQGGEEGLLLKVQQPVLGSHWSESL